MLKQEQGFLQNPSMLIKLMDRYMMRNRLFAQCQRFFLQMNLQRRNLAATINQMIQVNITSNEKATLRAS